MCFQLYALLVIWEMLYGTGTDEENWGIGSLATGFVPSLVVLIVNVDLNSGNLIDYIFITWIQSSPNHVLPVFMVRNSG